MKKLMAIVLMLSMLLGTTALAEDLGVQIIGDQRADTTPVSLDDIQLEKSIEIPGYAELTPTNYTVQDCIFQRKAGVTWTINRWSGKGNHYVDHLNKSYGFYLELKCDLHGDKNYPYYSEDMVSHYETKSQAEYALLQMSLLNITAIPKEYLKDCTVKVVFDDEIEYAGWARQQNVDYNTPQMIDPKDNFAIDPYYIGYYVFGATLPNSVISSDKPLRMEITIGGNEITYNIRK